MARLFLTSLLNNNDTFLFDCDGVIWNFPNIFPGAIELLNHLKEQVTTALSRHSSVGISFRVASDPFHQLDDHSHG